MQEGRDWLDRFLPSASGPPHVCAVSEGWSARLTLEQHGVGATPAREDRDEQLWHARETLRSHRPWLRPTSVCRPVDQGRFRVGLRVTDVAAAAEFYRGFGFTDVGTVPATDGSPLMTILERDGALLILDALEGMPFADDEREARTRAGPRGLGVAIGIGVDDLDASYEYCQTNGCAIRSEPTEEPWGDRVFECLDPFGYLLEISQPVADVLVDDALTATAEHWRDASP